MGLELLVGTRFQGLFHSALAVLFTFPSRYSCTIGRQLVLSLTRWSSQIHTGFHGPRATWEHHRELRVLSPTGLLPSVAQISIQVQLTPDFVTP